MKRATLIALYCLLAKISFADHITGGEMYYELISSNGSNYTYRITLKLFRHCGNVGAQLDPDAYIGIFDKSTNLLYGGRVYTPSMSRQEELRLKSPGPCISNAPEVCYEVGYYEFTETLPASTHGYTISYQRCCRIQGISNLFSSSNMGATYTAEIPGTNIIPTAPANNSAKFTARDTVIVCGGYPFTYNFGAQDPDVTDELRYSFCDAWIGGSSGNNGARPNPPANPPYIPVGYAPPYSGSSPLGPSVTIDPLTGIISGTSPPEGIYVVTVCVSEIRDGRVIAVQRKDLQIKAGGCDLTKPLLEPVMITCDGYNYDFSHPNNPNINSYYWEFGDPSTGASNFSNLQNPSHIFSDTGVFNIKVVANRGQECTDSTTAIVKVYPGFFPAFNSAGICIDNPVIFQDATTTNYGVVDSWAWNFGDETTTQDVSAHQDTSWKYSSTGTKTISLTVTSDKGCKKTITHDVTIIDKPPITLAFRDTLICVPDAVQLQASGTGNFSWTPTTNMTGSLTATPVVNPTATTKYYVQLDEQGCINHDSVLVRVVHFVTLNPMPDTTICRTDQAQLWVSSDGLRYEWTPAATLNDPSLQNPVATPVDPVTTYQVTARIGSCSANTTIDVTTIPYPIANAGPDTTICYNTPAYLTGSHDGSSFNWSPLASLLNANTLAPHAYPVRTQEYVLTSYDTKGCPKPGRDTVLVTVLPKIIPQVTNDTMVVTGQPLQFNAGGGVSYTWSPPTWLDNPFISNPVGIYNSEIDSIRYIVSVYNEVGCFDTASVKVTVFKTNPYIFVPNAFTPNNDGLNDVLRPIAVGIKQIKYFRIFNRWGQMVFSTTTNGHGWDGSIGGSKQGSNVYVWMAEATDYLDRPLQLKGTVTLIR